MLDPATNEHVDVTGDHYKVIREIGAAGTVLLKNKHNALPLRKPKKIGTFSAPFRVVLMPAVCHEPFQPDFRADITLRL